MFIGSRRRRDSGDLLPNDAVRARLRQTLSSIVCGGPPKDSPDEVADRGVNGDPYLAHA
jgi:hypothetical protein